MEERMTYAFFYDVPGTEGMYQRIKPEIGQEPPKGLVLHLVTTNDGGLRHLNVWESSEDWERYRQERVGPAGGRGLAAAGSPGGPAGRGGGAALPPGEGGAAGRRGPGGGGDPRAPAGAGRAATRGRRRLGRRLSGP